MNIDVLINTLHSAGSRNGSASRNILTSYLRSSLRLKRETGDSFREEALEFHPDDELSLSPTSVLLLPRFIPSLLPAYPVRLQHIFMEALSRTRIISSTM